MMMFATTLDSIVEQLINSFLRLISSFPCIWC